MGFEELSDKQWDYIASFLPPQPITGRRRADDRKVINGILFVLITGCRWGDMPSCYGSPVTAWRRLKRWSEEEIWSQVMDALRNSTYREGKLSLETVCVDSSFIETKKGEREQPTTDTKKRKE